MKELALAIDVGPEIHGYCIGDVAQLPPPILAAGVIRHGMLLELFRGENPEALGAPRPDLWYEFWADDAPPPILERFTARGESLGLYGEKTIENGGELSGAWYATTGTEVAKTSFSETCLLTGRVRESGKAYKIARELYGGDPTKVGGGKADPWIGTKDQPGPLWALSPRGMYPKDFAGERNHHKDAFIALLWWAYKRKGPAGP